RADTYLIYLFSLSSTPQSSLISSLHPHISLLVFRLEGSPAGAAGCGAADRVRRPAPAGKARRLFGGARRPAWGDSRRGAAVPGRQGAAAVRRGARDCPVRPSSEARAGLYHAAGLLGSRCGRAAGRVGPRAACRARQPAGRSGGRRARRRGDWRRRRCRELVLVDDPPRVIEELSDVEILDKMTASAKPRKRRGKKKRGPLDAIGLRRSLRLKRPDGFRDEARAAKAKAAAVPDASADDADEVVEEPVPLEMVLPGDNAIIPYQAGQADPSLPAAPHLPPSLLQSIGEKFLKMPPKVVSDDLLLASSDDE
ncbi:unnamed protein product, partial [Urochloa humidicola]